MAQDWYKNVNFDLDDMSHSSHLSDFYDDRLKALLKENGSQTIREVAENLNCAHVTIINQLHFMGFAQNLGTWIPHKLSDTNKEKRLEKAVLNLVLHRATRCHKQCFLYRIVTGDDKCGLHVNMKQWKECAAPEDRPKPTVKQDVHPKKRTICVLVGLGRSGILGNNVDKQDY